MTSEPPTVDELQTIAAAARRVAVARGADVAAADDVAQETISRLLTAHARLESAALLPYALTTAGNLMVGMHRSADRTRRHQHRLHDFGAPADPEAAALALEEAAAVRAALEALDPQDRLLFVNHAEGATTADLAAAELSTPAAIAARLSRTRARLRVDYLLALRRVQLPTAHCRRVLLAVSAADQRRQTALGTAGHLGECPTCVSLIPPLLQRSSTLAGIAAVPLVALGRFGGHLRRALHSHAVQATAGLGAVAVAAGVYAATSTHHATVAATGHTAPPVSVSSALAVSPRPGSVRTAAGITLIPVPGLNVLERSIGQRVVVRDMPVLAVVSHPGFWIGFGGQRLYVHLADADRARNRITAGRHVSFIAILDDNPAGFAAADGVTPGAGAGQLTAQGVHLTVDATKVVQS